MTALGAKRHDHKGRSVGKRKTNGRTRIGGQFSPRLVEMQRSPAYRVLSLSEHRCLDRLEIELADHGGTDNGRLPVTFDDFERYGVHRHSIAPALRALAALGFIEVTEEGRAGNAAWRRPTLFRLTHRNSATQEPTDEWRRIETMHEAETLARAARQATKKTKRQWRKPHHKSVRKPHHKGQTCSAESTTTGLSAETAPLSISRVGSSRRRRSAPDLRTLTAGLGQCPLLGDAA